VTGAIFDSMHASGRTAVLAGEHRREDLPWLTGRWGHSVVTILGGDPAASLDRLTRQAAEIAGPGHWQSGRRGRAHATVRALEPYSDDPPDEGTVARCWSVFEQVVGRPLHLSFDGLVLSPAGVMMRCRDLDGGADALRDSYGEALGPDGWLEDEVFAHGRDPVWYVTLLHFAGPLAAPGALVDWVEARADLPLGEVQLDTFSLCRWDLDDLGMAPTVLRTRRR
jgi:hypothetical protein